MEFVAAILSAAEALLYWRALLCMLGTALIAALLHLVVPGFTVAQAFIVGIFGLFPGSLWQQRATGIPEHNHGARRTSGLTASVAAVIAGGLWGLASLGAAQAVLVGAIMVMIGAIVWAWLAVRHQWFSSGAAALVSLVSLASYAVAVLVVQGAA